MLLEEVMTSEVHWVDPDTSVQEVAQLMRDLNVGAVPVCQDETPVGIITDRDIVIRSVAEGDINRAAQEVMTSDPITAPPDMPAEEAADLMAENQIRRLIVVDGGRLVGIVSLGDMAVSGETDKEAGEALSEISEPARPMA